VSAHGGRHGTIAARSRLLLVALALAAAALMAVHAARAAVLCAKPRKDGTFNSGVKIREVCKPNEVQLDPAAVGFCCGATSTTFPVTTTCPTTSTTTTLPMCTAGAAVCPGSGVCFNGHTCVVDSGTGTCGCTGPPPTCGEFGTLACGGTCETGSTCVLDNIAPPGCPVAQLCHCTP